MDSEPKVHHFVPQFYLRRFADDSGRLLVRTRDGRSFVASTRNVMARSGFYKVPRQPQTVEVTLSQFEAAASDAIDGLGIGTLPRRGSDERAALVVFIALQLSRSPETAAFLEFVHDVIASVGAAPVSRETMRAYLRDRVLAFTPHDLEVEAATDFVNVQASSPDLQSREELAAFRFRLMFDQATKALPPHLDSRMWSLEVSKRVHLITSDRPVTLWHPPSEKDWYQGVGLMDAEEIWWPLDSKRMLVLRKDGPERVRSIGPERVQFVNRHLARHCSKMIVSHPGHSEALNVPLARRRPVMRFWTGPLVVGSVLSPTNDVLQMWRPIRDVPDDWMEPWLQGSGGNSE